MTWRCVVCDACGVAADLFEAWARAFWHYEDEHGSMEESE